MSRTIRRVGWTRKRKTLEATERDEEARALRREQIRHLDATCLLVIDESMLIEGSASSLQTVDRAGHMIATLDLTRHTSTISQPVMQRLSLAFEIDVSLLPQVVRQFRQLIPPA